MPGIFTKIIAGEIPCHKIYEDEGHFAFLDIRPIRAGHALVIPKREVDYIFDMDDRALGDLMAAAKKVAVAIRAVVPCKKIGVTVVGLEVPHTHIHLVPIDSVGDIDFSRAKEAPREELAALAEKIRAAL